METISLQILKFQLVTKTFVFSQLNWATEMV